MALPFFYKEDITPLSKEIILDEATSKHIVQVVRMQNGEQLQLTNGKGNLFTAEITDNNRKKCTVTILKTSNIQHPTSNISLAVSLIKNTTRFEWFLEKATEIGVHEIIPLICERTEKAGFKTERMKNIVISAMLQSQQCWLPHLHEPTRFDDLMIWGFDDAGKYIAHCEEGESKKSLHHQTRLPDGQVSKSSNQLICIGPEGDFTKKEIEQALQNNFIPVSLGETRLRTETAGIVAATILRLM